MEDLTGKQLGPYQIVAPLGEGGMAAVYNAYHPGMDRYVAVKILPRRFASDPQFVGRFEQEAKVIAKLQHPHILPVFDYGEAEGYTYIVMPLVETGTLAQLLHGQPLPLKQIRGIISQVGDALDYAHSRGIVHRDVKPSNVLVDTRGNCLLTDFGIAKIVEETAKFTATGGVIGTPAYMSPEQGLGETVDRRSDIYSLGVILYEIATGRVPFNAETPIAIVLKHVNDPPPPPRTLNPALPKALERAILKSLAKRPEDRYATAADMVQALQSIRDTRPRKTPPVQPPTAISPRAARAGPGREVAPLLEELETEVSAAQRAEAERIAHEAAEQERVAQEKLEAGRLAAQKAEEERIAREKAEQERLAKEKAEAERLAAHAKRAEQERLAREKAEAERLAAQKAHWVDVLGRAQAAMRESRWADAFNLLNQLRTEAPEYERQTVESLRAQAQEAIQREQRLMELVQQAEAYTRQEKWAQAIEAFEQVSAINPDYRDTARRLEYAQTQLNWAELYAQGVKQQKARRWKEALATFQTLQGLAADYKDIKNLIAAAQGEIAREKAEAERLAAQKAEEERIAREKAEQERLAKEKAEAERLAAQKAEQERLAREKVEQVRLAREKAETVVVSRPRLELRGKIPIWGWVLGGLIALGALAVLFGGGGTPPVLPTATPTATPSQAASRTPQPTLTPTESRTAAHTPTRMHTPTATRTPTPTATRTPTRSIRPTNTPTRAPTATPTRTAAPPPPPPNTSAPPPPTDTPVPPPPTDTPIPPPPTELTTPPPP